MQYYTCPYCGANLDLGEHCDCLSAWEEQPVPTVPRWADDLSRKDAGQYIGSRDPPAENEKAALPDGLR